MKFQVLVDGEIYEVETEGGDNLSPIATPAVGTVQSLPCNLSTASECNSKICRSPVTGIVVQVCTQAGQDVAKDDAVVILEAMKMETKLTAPDAGRVKSVNVVAGDAVKTDQVLVEFE